MYADLTRFENLVGVYGIVVVGSNNSSMDRQLKLTCFDEAVDLVLRI